VENADPDPSSKHYLDLIKAQALLHQIYSRKFWKYVDKSRPMDGTMKKFKHSETGTIEADICTHLNLLLRVSPFISCLAFSAHF
jgi:hypothetical protein